MICLLDDRLMSYVVLHVRILNIALDNVPTNSVLYVILIRKTMVPINANERPCEIQPMYRLPAPVEWRTPKCTTRPPQVSIRFRCLCSDSLAVHNWVGCICT